MNSVPTIVAMTLACFLPAVSAQPALPEVREAMAGFIESREIAGAITVVGNAEGLQHFDTIGKANLAQPSELPPDTLFWIASMSKPITATAVMILQEQGKLSLDDAVSKHLSEFANLKDRDGSPASVTIRQCLAHTSGLAEVSGNETRDITSLEGLTPLIAAKPLQFTPGSEWRYCQSSINTAARVVEVVSGESFPEFLDHHLFQPLGMADTTFYLTDAQLPRLATSYARNREGELVEAPIGFLQGKSPTQRDRYPLANGGLFSTATDYAKFARMILRGGELDGARILSPESIQEMTSVQTGELETGFTPGNAWGVGWCLIREPQGVSEALSPGSFGHGGAFGTQAWIDPAKNRFYLLFVQRANFPNSDASDVRKVFQNSAAKALSAD
jgi:CubicO group peptidase (beta-lactamase class C family)